MTCPLRACITLLLWEAGDSFFPFMNLFYVSLGFSGKQIGFISSTSAIVGMLVSPVWVSEVKKHPQARRHFADRIDPWRDWLL